MKTKLSTKSSEQGTALIVALFLTTILAVTIAGYMKHANQQHLLSMRSQVWNSSISVSEAGIEEALQQLNTNPTNLNANGWYQSGTTYTMSRALSTKARYTVTIDAANLVHPEITSVAYLAAPSTAQAGSGLGFAAIGVDSSYQANLNEITSRAIQVKTAKSGLWVRPLTARHQIDMNGNGVMTDSFDSRYSSYSDNGMYPAGKRWKIRNNGDVASNDSILNAINVGVANIHGHVEVGPGGTVAIGPMGGVGTYDWQYYNPGTIQPGYFSDDMNFTFPSISLPYTTGLTPTAGSISETNYVFSSSSNTVTTATYPSPVPPSGVTTNFSYKTVSSLPSPAPYGSTTNVLTVWTKEDVFPKEGTYTGTPYLLGSKWWYNLITGTNYTYPLYTYTYSTEVAVTNYTVNTVNYDYIIQGGSPDLPPVQYYVNDIPKGTIYVTGNAQLVVGNNIKQAASDYLKIATDGKLEMWVGGTSIGLAGKGVYNETGYAQNFILWGADSVTSLAYAGNGEFTGVITAPNANATLSGSGVGDQDFIGTLIANTITFNGKYKFHYDEALRDVENGRYLVTEWNEIPVTEAYSTSAYTSTSAL